jgi:outer membrane protein with beta-barrel domain
MRVLVKTGMVLSAMGAFLVGEAGAQLRGVVGVGASVPVGEFADETGPGAQAGGGTALAGLEWLPEGKSLGLRLDGTYNRFCTELCDEASGDLDVRFRFLNANLSGIAELPLGAGSDFRPYLLGGVGLYNYKLEGDDVPDGLTDSENDFGLSGGVGMTYHLGQVGVFAEGRFHNVFTSEEDIQYIPVLVGARITFR